MIRTETVKQVSVKALLENPTLADIEQFVETAKAAGFHADTAVAISTTNGPHGCRLGSLIVLEATRHES